VNTGSRLERLEKGLRDIGLEPVKAPGVLRVDAQPESLVPAARLAVEHGYDHLASVEGIDWPSEGVIEVIYHAESYDEDLRGTLLEIRVKVPRDEPRLPSLIEVWPNALFLERETWDLMGVVFEGHPELRRLLMPPDWDGPPPLRKDFKVKTEGVFVNVE